MGHLQNYQDQFTLLVEAGFIAVNQADEDSAVKLFRAAQVLRPEHSLAKIGMGYVHLCKLELKQACKAFEEILQEQPQNEMAKTFLGLCLSLTTTDVDKGESLLKESAKKTQDPLLKDLAHSAVEFVEKYVKKAPTPTQGHIS